MLDKPKIIVLGVGNLLLQDEGVGVHVVKMLSNILTEAKNPTYDYPNLEIIDGGTSPEIASLIEGAEKLIIIDAVKGGKEPGTVYRFAIDDVAINSSGNAGVSLSPKEAYLEIRANLSLHQMNIIDNLQMLSLIGKQPKEVIVIGIEPKTIELGLELTPEIQSKIPKIITLVKDEIEKSISSPLMGED